MNIGITSEQRRVVCVHEAAHAVVWSINRNSFIYRVAVAPVGATELRTTNRKGFSCSDLFGVCETSDAPMTFSLSWSDEEGGYLLDKQMFRMYMECLKNYRPALVRETYRSIKACIMGFMAGPIAEAILDAQPLDAIDRFPDDWQEGEDLTVAQAMCLMLRYRNEYDKLFEETYKLLRDSQTWGNVIRLADAIEEHGELYGDVLDDYLGRKAA